MWYLLQADLSLAPNGYRGSDLIIWGIVILSNVIFRFTLPRFNKKNSLIREIFTKLESIDHSLADAKSDRDWFNSNTIERMDNTTNSIEILKIQVDTALRAALLGNIYDRRIHSHERMLNLLAYLKIGGDGNCLNDAIQDLILPDPELWNSVLAQPNAYTNILDEKHFCESLETIKNAILEAGRVQQ